MKTMILMVGLLFASTAHAEEVTIRGDVEAAMESEDYPSGVSGVRIQGSVNEFDRGYLLVEFKPGVFAGSPTCVFSNYYIEDGFCRVVRKPTYREFTVQCAHPRNESYKVPPRMISFICTGEKP